MTTIGDNEVEALRAEVERLTRERDEARDDFSRVDDERIHEYGMRLKAEKERDALAAQVAAMREALEMVRDAMRSNDEEPDGMPDPRRPIATKVWAALALPASEAEARVRGLAEAVRWCAANWTKPAVDRGAGLPMIRAALAAWEGR